MNNNADERATAPAPKEAYEEASERCPIEPCPIEPCANVSICNVSNCTVSKCTAPVFNEVPCPPSSSNVSSGVRLPVDKDVPDRDNESESSDQQSEDNEGLSSTSEGEAIELSNMEASSPPRKLRDRDSIRKPKRYETNLIQYDIPTSFQEAITGPEAKEWTRAVEDELVAHEKNDTWTIVLKMTNQRFVDSKWVFKMLQDTDGAIKRHKARLCARGFQQKFGVDYTETFAPVVRYDSLRVILALVTHQDLEMMQFDIKTVFLYDDLEKTIYMKIPEGLKVKDSDNALCKLNKSLYGLKQAPRCWNKKFNDFSKRFDFRANHADNQETR
ncbi:retrovirus-related pol polyprotein from transposon tnt 1-94 [Lasius niger]|uniref:Retrovirus-related pol polyprotein from transposon tnt 1-94 n=1 Tax=Lasius niger TaxID=67767 RepID=A0A0J7K833_LASNI|nr:retrovirus-related pol polyprotein from transposon tnt 1-94 [Lasius niger]